MMHVQGQLWWAEQNVRLALAAASDLQQRRLATALVSGLSGLPAHLSEMCVVLTWCA
jgi:hypothetical protein